MYPQFAGSPPSVMYHSFSLILSTFYPQPMAPSVLMTKIIRWSAATTMPPDSASLGTPNPYIISAP